MVTGLMNNKQFKKLKEVNPVLFKTVTSLFDELVQIRRDLRKHPELAFQENRTSSIVAKYLKSWGYEVQEGVGKTGVIGILRGQEEGKVIGLRADMDALPMPDEIEEEYKSIHEGVAHTCGHDIHTTNLLGVAKVFSLIGVKKGTLKLIFQPAEEIGDGAKAMIEDGALENPRMDMMAGLHVAPSLRVGEFSVSNAEYSGAAVDIFKLEVSGKGGHAAHPHLAIDSVMITAQILVALQQIVSRQIDPLDSVVLSIGQINGGTKGTILPDTVTVNGTVRTLKPETRKEMEERIRQIADNIAAAFGGSCKLTYDYSCPSVKNDDAAKQFFIETVTDIFGHEAIQYSNPSMGGEDFSYFSQEVPAVFFRLGTSSGEATSYSIHNTKFNGDEKAMLYGVAIMSCLVQSYLQKEEW
ncbi:amidohydrolase [Cytobacillus depressus]|uniref:Amidohydrolase n=1 Tax=Cytobacillus depressus TaxID=1602942 RepID=A0A6L3VB36_9BACI|nr:M20 family metallopeptidase [Cytobacillus depressus]KAB2336732.1 amidohydrolase [Cytobacillus depressus]